MSNSFTVLFKTTKNSELAGINPALAALNGVNTAQLRWLILGPVMVVIFMLIAALVTAVYRQANEEIERKVLQLQSSVDVVYRHNLDQLTGMLAGISGTLVQGPRLRRALERNDRAEISKVAEPVFDVLRQEHGITHFSIFAADRTVLFRAHDPGYFGDVISRITAIEAQQTNEPAHGVELGTDGILALRFVSPVFTDASKKHLIGFIELAVYTGQLLKDMQKSLGIQLFEFLSKQSLSRDAWLKGVSDPARAAEWGRFPEDAPSAQALKEMTPELSVIMSNKTLPSTGSMMSISLGESDYRAIALPLLDIGNHKVGSFILLVDVTSKAKYARDTLTLGLKLGAAGGGILFAFFWFLTGRIGRLIEQHQKVLNHLATRDSLTGLFNQTTFYTLLEDEIARSQRSGTPVSLLMLDLDHFKGVNDKFGHIAGDLVIKEFGKIVYRQSRAIDKVCHYGGEELAVILTETSATGAMTAAEHLRAAIEGHLFHPAEGKDLSLTISIGIATVPEQAASAQDLVSVADRALYIAKELGRNRVYRYIS